MNILVPNIEFARLASDENIADTVAALSARGMAAYVLENSAQARNKVLELLPEGAEVYTSLSRTVETLGLSDDVNKSSRYIPLRPQADKMDRETRKSREGRKFLSSPECVIGSVHAV